jgi:O-antigen/teichoic acid export membrane protein
MLRNKKFLYLINIFYILTIPFFNNNYLLKNIYYKNNKNYVRLSIDPLYKNSIYILVTLVLNAGLGFSFWILAANFYSEEDVGIASAIISSLGILLLLSRLGVNEAIIRFFNEKNKSEILGTSLVITTACVIISGIIFIVGIDLWSPKLSVLKNYSVLYLIFLSANSITSIIGIFFIASRKADCFFLQNLLVAVRLPLLFPFIFLGYIGIFSSLGVSFIISIMVSILLLGRLGVMSVKLDKMFLKKSFNFSIGNYIAELFINAPSFLLPLMVFNYLGAKETANYYMAYTIASIIFFIPYAFKTSFFVECCHGEMLKKAVFKSLIAIFALLIPAMVIIYFFGGLLLGLIGPSYVQGLDLLRIFVLSSFFVAILSVYYGIKQVQKDIKGLIFLSILIFILIIGTSNIFIPKFGIIGVGYAWVISYGLGCIIVGAIAKREMRI